MRALAPSLLALLVGALALARPAAGASRVTALFPSDDFTVADPAQLTGRRVALPLPNCTVDPSGCDEIRLLNQLDGFSLNPRVALRVSAPLDLGSVTRDTVFLLPLGGGAPVGLARLVWDPEGRTLYGHPERLLNQGSRYALVVTGGVRDADGQPLMPSGGTPATLGRRLEALGVMASRVVALSSFTTQSVTADLEKIRRRLDQLPAARLRFDLARGRRRSIFPRREIARMEHRRHVRLSDDPYAPVPLPLALIPPAEVNLVAFGAFSSPSFLTPDRIVPQVPTRTGTPRIQREEEVHVTVMLPAGPKPARGWPVAVFGHGYGGDRHASLLAVAGTLARHGFATLGINVIGHGGGDKGALVIERAGRETVTLPSGGRGTDLDRDGQIGPTEGVGTLAGGRLTLVSNRDGIRQTVADLMRLFRAVRAGVDVDGDGAPDLDGEQLYYFGQSFGGIYGTLLVAVDPLVTVGVLNVPGGPIVEVARLSPVFRKFVIRALRDRRPPLLNGADDFHESLPLPDEPPVTAPHPGAIAVQEFLDRAEWLSQPGNPVAYALHLKLAPLAGNGPKAVLYQLAVGDRTVPNATTLNILRAGDLLSSTSAFRHDRIADQLGDTLQDPHAFLTWTWLPSVAGIGRAAQEQVARFFLSRGARIEHPDFFDPKPHGVPVFEVPFRE
ncbi:MAG: hypothetical protein HY726_08310 [Candidatus Rokubacteria bacterium]|nr:hypothetical protein [Candidatus Rokubacteria bacterium]